MPFAEISAHLPADTRAHSSRWRIDDANSGTVALAPDEPFRACRHQLAVRREELAVWVDGQCGTFDPWRFVSTVVEK